MAGSAGGIGGLKGFLSSSFLYTGVLSEMLLACISFPNNIGFFLMLSTTCFSASWALVILPICFILESGYLTGSFIVTDTPPGTPSFASRTFILFSFWSSNCLSRALSVCSSSSFFWTVSRSSRACFVSSSLFLVASCSYLLISSSFFACSLTFFRSFSSYWILLFDSAGDSPNALRKSFLSDGLLLLI